MAEVERIAVGHVGPDARGRGGMAAVIRALADTDLAREFRLRPITTHRQGSSRPLTFARGLGRFVRWAVREDVRVAHVHVTVRGSLCRKVVVVAVAKVLRVPVLLHVHAGAAELARFHDRLRPMHRRAARAAFRAADVVVAVSDASAHEVRERYGARSVEVLPNPAPRLDARRNGGHRASEVLYLGGFANPVKGGDILLEALPAVRLRVPDVRFTLAGPGEPPTAGLVLLAGDPLVTWAGYLDEEAKRDALRRAAVVVLPSTSEGLPVTLLEAMAAGAAIVATRVGGIPDVAVHEHEAVLLDAGDSAALADAISALLADVERATRLGAAARARAATLSPDVIACRLASMYRELSARG